MTTTDSLPYGWWRRHADYAIAVWHREFIPGPVGRVMCAVGWHIDRFEDGSCLYCGRR